VDIHVHPRTSIDSQHMKWVSWLTSPARLVRLSVTGTGCSKYVANLEGILWRGWIYTFSTQMMQLSSRPLLLLMPLVGVTEPRPHTFMPMPKNSIHLLLVIFPSLFAIHVYIEMINALTFSGGSWLLYHGWRVRQATWYDLSKSCGNGSNYE